MAISSQFIQKTIDFFSQRYGRRISEQEAQGIIETSVETFRTLIKWQGECNEAIENSKVVAVKDQNAA